MHKDVPRKLSLVQLWDSGPRCYPEHSARLHLLVYQAVLDFGPIPSEVYKDLGQNMRWKAVLTALRR